MHIEDSSNLDFDWKINGNQYQATREGYNLLDLTSLIGKTETKNGITYKINNDGSITLNGTATDYTSFNLLIQSLKSGTYKFTNGQNYNYVFLQGIGSWNETSQNRVFSVTEDGDATMYLVVLQNTPTLNNFTLYPMIQEGTEDKPYEQYGASPSPDYPSEVETVESNVNEFNINTVSYGDLDTTTGEKINDVTNIQHSDYIEVASNENYVINFNNTLTKRVFYLDKDKNVISTNIVSTKISKFTTSENVKYFRVKIVGVFDKKTKLEKGSIATPYSPYGMGSVEIDVVNKNLLNIANTEETTKGGITYSIKNGILKLNGTATSNLEIQLSKNIKIKKGKYTHSSSYIQSGLYISFDNLMYTMIRATVGKKITFELTEDTTYKRYFIWIDKGTVLNNVEIKLQLEVGDTATDFVEHQSQTAIMPIQQEMLEGDYVADVEHHEWGKIVLTGNENWIKGYDDGTERENLGFRVELEELKQIDKTQNYVLCGALCNYLKESLFFTKDISKEVWGNLNTFALSMSAQYTLALNTENINTVEELKSFLNSKYEAGTPVTIYYKLAEPINLELTPEQKVIREQKLYTYKNITNIDVSDELASIDVTYKKDLETMFNNIIKQIPSSTSDTAET